MACTGAAGEACGGSNRISIYEKTATAGGTPKQAASPTGWGSLGCYSDSVGARILSDNGIVDGGPSAMTPKACTDACKKGDFKYAGVEYSGECFCGNTIQNGHTAQTSGCDMTCNGDSSQMCGGANRINLYQFGISDPQTQTGWVAQGCYTDSVATRSLSVGMGVQGQMTNQKCKDACRNAGYTLAGTEYAAECFCDNQLRNGGGPAPDGNDQCNMLCAGNQTEVCGGSNRLTLFKWTDGTQPASSTTPATTPTPTTPSATPTRSNTASATATGLPDGFTYKGCYVDGPGFRIMGNQQPDSNTMTISSCSKACADLGYTIAGMEFSTQCFCDNVIRMGGQLASDDTQCGMQCAGDATEKCGGPDRLSVWSSQTTLKVVQKPKPKATVGNWNYQGCISDPQGVAAWDRVFPWQLVNKTGNSAEWCLGQCAEYGYMAAGMEYGEVSQQ